MLSDAIAQSKRIAYEASFNLATLDVQVGATGEAKKQLAAKRDNARASAEKLTEMLEALPEKED